MNRPGVPLDRTLTSALFAESELTVPKAYNEYRFPETGIVVSFFDDDDSPGLDHCSGDRELIDQIAKLISCQTSVERNEDLTDEALKFHRVDEADLAFSARDKLRRSRNSQPKE